VRRGDILLLYFIWYPATRFFLEFLRVENWRFGAIPMAQIVSLVLIAIAVGVLVWRRRRPVAVLAALTLVTSVQYLALGASQGLGSFLPPLAAVYAVGRYAEASSLVTAAALALVGTAVHELRDPNFQLDGAAITFWVILAAAWPLGRALQVRETNAAELQWRAQRLHENREQEAAAAELHDVVGHGLTVATIQVVAALGALDKQDGTGATGRLLNAERTLRETLAEMRRLVSFVDEAETAQVTPASLANVQHLVDGVRASGITVDLQMDPAPNGLPPGVDQAGYRIVQEALTNVVRHAQGARATVTIRRGEEALELEVIDNGPGREPGAQMGRGIAGMRQRAALYGGQLSAGPGADGGYQVHARLPLVEASP
jgi:signal transduction histidine kinase